MQQTTQTLLMVRPAAFRMNEQTAVNNYFQQDDQSLSNTEINKRAQNEFDAFVTELRAKGITVLVFQDTEASNTPDSIFPNNWISFHTDGTVGVYPMFAKNRRKERKEEVLCLIEEHNFLIESIRDYTEAEEEDAFLEGTGSVILDRVNKIAYCAISPRADESLFIEFCEDFDYHPVVFHAYQDMNKKRELIYHTNVMMAIANKFAVICLDTIDDKKERKEVVRQLKNSGKEIIEISEIQMHHFAGNMLQVKNKQEQYFLVMSSAAYKSLSEQQIKKINQYCEIIHSSLVTIE